MARETLARKNLVCSMKCANAKKNFFVSLRTIELNCIFFSTDLNRSWTLDSRSSHVLQVKLVPWHGLVSYASYRPSSLQIVQ